MPSWEAALNAMAYQFMPGEMPANGASSLGGNGWKGPIVIPADFYANPERWGFLAGSYFPTHAVELQASLSLYDYRNQDNCLDVPTSLDDLDEMIVYVGPRTWRSIQIYNIAVVPPTEPFGPYYTSMSLMGVGH